MSARALVLGAGVDALVAAHLLSRAYAVTVIADEEIPDEPAAGWVPAAIVRALGLRGVKTEGEDPWAVAPLPGGGRLELWQEMARSVEAIRRVSARDAERWPIFCGRMARLARFLERIYLEPAPDPLGLRFALRARRLGREGLTDLMRLLPMPVAELLDDWFENDTLKGVLGASGVLHLQQGPRSGGTAFRLLHHHAGCPPGVFRPPGSNFHELLRGRAGPASRTGAVGSVLLRGGRVAGVALQSGEQIDASLVVSGLHPRRTLLELVDPGRLDPQLVRGLKHLRDRPICARVTLELDRAPAFRRLVLAPSLDELERACDDSKYGRVSSRPYLEARSDGSGRVTVDVQYVPAGAEARALPDVAAAMLSEHFGDASIVSTKLAAPRQPHQVELALDQALWMRPLPELAQYRTPLEGLWLCGPAMHPGAGIAGANGYNCARAILKAATR